MKICKRRRKPEALDVLCILDVDSFSTDDCAKPAAWGAITPSER